MSVLCTVVWGKWLHYANDTPTFFELFNNEKIHLVSQLFPLNYIPRPLFYFFNFPSNLKDIKQNYLKLGTLLWWGKWLLPNSSRHLKWTFFFSNLFIHKIRGSYLPHLNIFGRLPANFLSLNEIESEFFKFCFIIITVIYHRLRDYNHNELGYNYHILLRPT